MERKAKRKLTGLKVAAVAVVLVLGPLGSLYVASIGPAAQRVDDELLAAETFYRFYAPIIRITESVPITNRLIAGYLHRWGVTTIIVERWDGGHEVRWEYFTVDPQ